MIISGFYRTWGKSQKMEEEMEGLCEIFNKVGNENGNYIALGDANLNKLKFHEHNYPYKSLRDKLLNTLAQNDMNMVDLPPTYISKSNGCQSELDHIYYSAILVNDVNAYIDECAASDHCPIVLELNIKKSMTKK